MLVNNRQLLPVGMFLACYVPFPLFVCDCISGVPLNRLEQGALPLSTSSPVARDHWGIFELIIKESGDVRTIPLSRFSLVSDPARVRVFPNPT